MGGSPHLCAEPYCTRIIDGPGRCPDHQQPARSGTTGYGASWRRARDAYIAAHPRCERCPAPAVDVHHRDGRHPSEPGANAWHNLESLCRSCHRRATEHAKRDARDEWGGELMMNARRGSVSKPTRQSDRKSARGAGGGGSDGQ
jgi:5-methylcytosine-specific restriction enzyme A